MASYEAVIGLEIHAQLKTASKLFCSCPTTFWAGPNEQVCEVCGGMPGALPRLNEKAVELAAKAGLALNCTVNEYSVFSRKNYFYPDLPAGFQTWIQERRWSASTRSSGARRKVGARSVTSTNTGINARWAR